jgi:hypothetical protein
MLNALSRNTQHAFFFLDPGRGTAEGKQGKGEEVGGLLGTKLGTM